MFQCTLLNPIRDDLLEYLWLNERYNCQGLRSRGYGFMFYPSMVVMMLREVCARSLSLSLFPSVPSSFSRSPSWR